MGEHTDDENVAVRLEGRLWLPGRDAGRSQRQVARAADVDTAPRVRRPSAPPARTAPLARQGLDALLAEVSKTGGGHAGALYLTAAVERIPLSETEVSQVLAAALEHPPNDAVLERLLVSTATRFGPAARKVRSAYLAVASRIEARAARETVMEALAR